MKNFTKNLFGKNELCRTLMAVFGTLIFAVGTNLFIVPAGVYSGGLMGICQVIRTILMKYFHLTFSGYDIAGIVYYVLNVPLFFLGYRTMGKLFFIKTMICTVTITFFLTVIPVPSQLIVNNDVLTSCLIGGIVSGVGSGLYLIMGGACGGMDIIGLYLIKRRNGSSVGKVTLTVNSVLYIVCFVLFDITTTIYSIIVAAAASITMDKLHSQNINVEVTIISKKDLRQFQSDFMRQTGRGISKWNFTGAYTNENSELIYIILSKYEVNQLKQMVRQYDPDAFIVVNEGVSVDGNYLKKL